MYYDFAGREIEDLEGDNMRMDWQEAQRQPRYVINNHPDVCLCPSCCPWEYEQDWQQEEVNTFSGAVHPTTTLSVRGNSYYCSACNCTPERAISADCPQGFSLASDDDFDPFLIDPDEEVPVNGAGIPDEDSSPWIPASGAVGLGSRKEEVSYEI